MCIGGRRIKNVLPLYLISESDLGNAKADPQPPLKNWVLKLKSWDELKSNRTCAEILTVLGEEFGLFYQIAF